MTKWEYILVHLSIWITEKQITEELNKYGDEGWEYCDISEGSMIFKRPAGKV